MQMLILLQRLPLRPLRRPPLRLPLRQQDPREVILLLAPRPQHHLAIQQRRQLLTSTTTPLSSPSNGNGTVGSTGPVPAQGRRLPQAPQVQIGNTTITQLANFNNSEIKKATEIARVKMAMDKRFFHQWPFIAQSIRKFQ